ncbi:hypothetical protein BXP70_27785 [Hymenobacter crusticola]|uniref:Uncharacterized protein n=1 Tax=Hymenobacter crusticola TaxID=1770526 RepID=A0A243W7R2_9BACT|nr:hypothetical protein BXP70_27785 [Hymenobacter crusticola]
MTAHRWQFTLADSTIHLFTAGNALCGQVRPQHASQLLPVPYLLPLERCARCQRYAPRLGPPARADA